MCTYIHTYAHAHARTHLCTHALTHLCTHARTHLCTHARTHLYSMHAHIYAHMHAHIRKFITRIRSGAIDRKCAVIVHISNILYASCILTLLYLSHMLHCLCSSPGSLSTASREHGIHNIPPHKSSPLCNLSVLLSHRRLEYKSVQLCVNIIDYIMC